MTEIFAREARNPPEIRIKQWQRLDHPLVNGEKNCSNSEFNKITEYLRQDYEENFRWQVDELNETAAEKAEKWVCKVIEELENPSLPNPATSDMESGAANTSDEDGEKKRRKRARGGEWIRT